MPAIFLSFYVRLPPVQGEPLAGVDDPLDAPLAGLGGIDAVAGFDVLVVPAVGFSPLKICGRSKQHTVD